MHVFLGCSLKNKVVNPKNKSGSVTSSVVLVSDRSLPNVFPSVVLLPVSMFVASPHCLYMKEQVTFVEAAPLINITVLYCSALDTIPSSCTMEDTGD